MRLYGLEFLLHLPTLVAHPQARVGKEQYNCGQREAGPRYFRYLGRCAAAGHPCSLELPEFQRVGLASVNYSLG